MFVGVPCAVSRDANNVRSHDHMKSLGQESSRPHANHFLSYATVARQILILCISLRTFSLPSLFLAVAGAPSCSCSVQMLLHTPSEVFYLPHASVQRCTIVLATLGKVPSLTMHDSFGHTLSISS